MTNNIKEGNFMKTEDLKKELSKIEKIFLDEKIKKTFQILSDYFISTIDNRNRDIITYDWKKELSECLGLSKRQKVIALCDEIIGVLERSIDSENKTNDPDLEDPASQVNLQEDIQQISRKIIEIENLIYPIKIIKPEDGSVKKVESKSKFTCNLRDFVKKQQEQIKIDEDVETKKNDIIENFYDNVKEKQKTPKIEEKNPELAKSKCKIFYVKPHDEEFHVFGVDAKKEHHDLGKVSDIIPLNDKPKAESFSVTKLKSDEKIKDKIYKEYKNSKSFSEKYKDIEYKDIENLRKEIEKILVDNQLDNKPDCLIKKEQKPIENDKSSSCKEQKTTPESSFVETKCDSSPPSKTKISTKLYFEKLKTSFEQMKTLDPSILEKVKNILNKILTRY